MSVFSGKPSVSDAALADSIYQYNLYSGDFEPSNDPFFHLGSQPARDYTLLVSTKKDHGAGCGLWPCVSAALVL